MLKHGWVTLSKSVNIKHCDEIIQFVEASKGQCFPDGPFSTFTVSNQTVDTVTEDKRA